MDELADRLRRRPDRAADPQRARRRPGDRPAVVAAATSSPACATGARAVRLGRARPAAGRPSRRRLAGRHRRRRVDVPACTGCPATARASASRPTAATRCRSAPPTSAPATWTALTQIAADALGVPARAVDLADRRHRPAAGVGRGRFVRHQHLGVGDRRRGAGVPRGARRRSRRRATRPTADAPEQPRRRALRACTRSARSSPRCGSTATPARSACPRMLGVFSVGRIINPRTAALAAASAA